MAQREIKGKIILRNDGSSEWGTANPVLSKGEIGIDTSGTPYKVKIGNGTSDWIALPYFEIEQQYVSGLTTALSDIEDGIKNRYGSRKFTRSSYTITNSSRAITSDSG